MIRILITAIILWSGLTNNSVATENSSKTVIYNLANISNIISINSEIKNSLVLNEHNESIAIYYSNHNFKKWAFITAKSTKDSIFKEHSFKLNEWNNFSDLNFYYHQKTGLTIVTYGILKIDMDKIILTLDKQNYSLLKFFFQNAYASENCVPRSNATKEIESISKEVNLQNIFNSCDWNAPELIKKALTNAADQAKGVFDIHFFTKMKDALKQLSTTLSQLNTEMLRQFKELAKESPEFVNQWSCEKLRSKVPLIALSVFLPQMGARQIPVLTAEIFSDIKLMVSYEVRSIIRGLQQRGKLSADTKNTLINMTRERPEIFDEIKILNEGNFLSHAKNHANEFNKDGSPISVEDYIDKLATFSKKKHHNDVYVPSARDRVIKFNPDTGESLVLGQDGNFVSYYIVRGNTPDERMRTFLNKQGRYESENQR